MIEEIAREIRLGYAERNMTAVFHYQVLIHARELEGFDPETFCRQVGVPASYKTEFRKMMGLAKLMGQLGVRIARAS